MPYITAPHRVPLDHSTPVVFLAGSIEMGRADPWQEDIAQMIKSLAPEVVVANPRRVDWDNSWKQELSDTNFRQQVQWELDHLDRADLVVFYFQGGTQSPITLLEFGRHMTRIDASTSTLVCCPKDFWRRGNIEVVMDRAGMGLPLDSYEQLKENIKKFRWDLLAQRTAARHKTSAGFMDPANSQMLAQLVSPSPSSDIFKTYQPGTPHAWEKYIPEQIIPLWDLLPHVARNALILQAQEMADREEWD